MTAEQLKAAGAIYFEHVMDGIKDYDNRIVRMNVHQACDKFMELWENAGYRDVYVDFYYFRLDREVQKKVESILSPQEREYIRKMSCTEGQVIFPANEVLFSICAKLNDAEMLFCTIYVTGEQKSTWWGNYNREYIVFTEKKQES